MIAALLVVATTAAAPDPRIELVELQLAGQYATALTEVEAELENPSRSAAAIGLDYLRGHLLEILGRPTQAHQAFADAMSSQPRLADYSRFRLAVNQHRMSHPEVAAGLLATLLGGNPPMPLVPRATALLVRSLAEGGDCRLLANLGSWRLPGRERRQLELASVDCALARGDREQAMAQLTKLVREDSADESARGAAERIDAYFPRLADDPVLALAVGAAFHRHRQFDQAIQYLTRALENDPSGLRPDDLDEAFYSLARSYFWNEKYLIAASHFGQLAARARNPRDKARALYQQARCYELYGRWREAANNFRFAYLAEPTGRWADAALLAALRLEWRIGDEEAALELYGQLGARREWRGLRRRAALFLAASDLVRERSERAGAWLDDSAQAVPAPDLEVSYWRGRLAELEGRREGAVRHYLTAAARDPWHPLGSASARRLNGRELAPAAAAVAARLARSRDPADLETAWTVLGDADPAGAAARAALEDRLARDPRARPYLEMRPRPPAAWPLWASRLHQPEELLLALGIWDQAATVVLKHFPATDASLALTGSRLLADAREVRRSLYVAEVLGKRVPREVPERLLPAEMRRLLYPLPYRVEIVREARARGVDPLLLAAIIREESRFDPQAISPASARGLTQFVLPTAQRVAGQIGLEGLEAPDLHDPATSIALGAAYLAELGGRFGQGSWEVVAAYNAGEPQAQLWRSYCYSREPEELFTKVGFPETRGYLERVLASRAHYAAIWGAELAPAGGG